MEIRQETDIKVQIRKTLFEIEQQKRARVQRFLLEIGLTPGQGQARILSSLAAAGNVTQRELADACLMDVTTMSRTLDRLEEKGLIRAGAGSPEPPGLPGRSDRCRPGDGGKGGCRIRRAGTDPVRRHDGRGTPRPCRIPPEDPGKSERVMHFQVRIMWKCVTLACYVKIT